LEGRYLREESQEETRKESCRQGKIHREIKTGRGFGEGGTFVPNLFQRKENKRKNIHLSRIFRNTLVKGVIEGSEKRESRRSFVMAARIRNLTQGENQMRVKEEG